MVVNQQLSQIFKMYLNCSPNLPLYFSRSWQTWRISNWETVPSPVFSRINLCPQFSVAFWPRSIEFYSQLFQKINNLSLPSLGLNFLIEMRNWVRQLLSFFLTLKYNCWYNKPVLSVFNQIIVTDTLSKVSP